MPSKDRITIDCTPVTGSLKISGMSLSAPSLLPWRTTVDNLQLHQLLSHLGEHRNRPRKVQVRAGRCAASAERRALGPAGESRPAAPCGVFLGSFQVAIALAFVGSTVSEMTAANKGIGQLPIHTCSAMKIGLPFAGLVVVGAKEMGI